MRISIVTVCLNSVKTIERTIKSVTSQDYDNVEYIVIDGGSTDGTVDIIQKYEQYISCWISEKDDGIYDAMNKGIDRATGDVIAFLNSDDWYEENIFGEIARRFEDSELQVLCGDMYCHKDGTVIRHHVSEQKGRQSMRYEMGYPHQTMFVKKDLFDRYGKLDTHYQITADYDWLLRVYDRHVKIGVINKVLTNFSYGGISTREDLIDMQIEERRQVALLGLERNQELTIAEKENWRKLIENIYAESRYYRKEKSVISKIKTGDDDDVLSQAKKVFDRNAYEVFGCGSVFEELRSILKSINISITKLWDNDKKKWGKTIDGIEIGNPKHMMAGQNMIIIASTNYEKEIERQLRQSGFSKNVDYILYSELRKQIVEAVS